MKRLIKKPIVVLEETLNIEIYPVYDTIQSSDFVFDVTSPEYYSFIESMVSNFEIAGYQLLNDPDYTHRSDRGSQSWYYTFFKQEEGVEIRVIVNVRVSDHANKDKPWRSADESRTRYVNNLALDIAKKSGSNKKPIARKVDIIIDGKHLKSYSAAIFYLHDQIEEVEESYQEWKENNL